MSPWVLRGAIAAAGLLLVGGAIAGTLVLFGGGEAGNEPVVERPATAVVLAAGDVGDCEEPGDEATAKVLERYPDATILVPGDLAYPHGRTEDFERCYEPNWGRFVDRTKPAPGNHDYATKDAAGYFEYFGTAAGDPDQGWYSFDVGAWHVVSLNSECRRVGGCEFHEPQAQFLIKDLRDSSAKCQIAFFHRPPFSSGRYGDDTKNIARMRILWRILAEHKVEVVLVGHEHSYERFEPMDEEGNADPIGTRLFVVGTGGGNLRKYRNPPQPTTAVRNADTWGVLKLDLGPTTYKWEFLRAAGGDFSDAGSGTCR